MIQHPGRLLCLVLFCCCSFLCRAEKVFDFNTTCQKAYAEITALKLNAGQQLINQARQQNPDNLIPDYLESYIDFFILFFNEDPDEYKVRKPHFDARLDKLSEGPDNSPFNRYCRAVVILQKAAVAIKFGERWSAGWDFKKGFGLIKDNRKSFPSFAPNDLIYGPMQVAIGTIPNGYKWLANLFGMRGSIKDGMHLMRKFLNSSDPWARLFFNEATFYYCYLQFYIENKPEEVLQFISQRKLDVVNNHLFAYLAANLGINDKKNEYGKNVILNKNPSPEYMYTPVWDFEMGYAKMRHLELQDAIRYFESFLQHFKGRFYVKDVYQKLSWCYYLTGNTAAANNARQLILKKGSTDTDADKQANREAKTTTWPNPLLLKARLLSDGGYNREALAMLDGKTTDHFATPEEKLEFAYRVARIYDDLGRDSAAIQAYLAAIKLGEKRPEYYAARAALQIGFIYERQGKKALAIAFYQQCLDMEDHEYKDSLDQKAKAGIARCKGQ
jgi:tetratricopeptide (TPR) repeat protein